MLPTHRSSSFLFDNIIIARLYVLVKHFKEKFSYGEKIILSLISAKWNI